MLSYSQMIQYPTFEERLEYLSLDGVPFEETFGHARYLNQQFYMSYLWRKTRTEVIARDNGCDLALDGYPIHRDILVHHINPITVRDIESHNPAVVDLDNLVCVSYNTHRSIHYGTSALALEDFDPRQPNDTIPWRRTT